jgi:hypothetical protein
LNIYLFVIHRKIRGVSEMNEKEVLMEYVAYLLHIGDDEEACTVMQVNSSLVL